MSVKKSEIEISEDGLITLRKFLGDVTDLVKNHVFDHTTERYSKTVQSQLKHQCIMYSANEKLESFR